MADKNLQVLLKKAKDYFVQVLLPRCEVVLSEVAISINWAEGKAEILEGVTGRQYPQREGWQNGTADLVCILKSGELLIADWKTGGSSGATEQLLSLACGFQLCLTTNPETGEEKTRPVRIACLSVTEEGVDPDERAVSDEQLANHWMAMEMRWTDKDKDHEPVPGIHCTQLYCPHLAYCNAVTGLVEDAAEGKQGQLIPSEVLTRRFRMTDNPRSAEEAGHVMSRVSAARRQMKYWEACMKEYIGRGGRVVAGQWEWKETGNGFRWTKVRN